MYWRLRFKMNYCMLYLTTLKAFDQHLNMVLGDVEESVTVREVDEETEEEIVKVFKTIVFYT